MPERNITFEIKEHLGTIANYETGWNKELNIISWNGAPAKYDIRDWDEFHTRMSRGVTLNPWEMRKMADLYLTRNSERAVSRGKAIEAERNKRRSQAARNNESHVEPEAAEKEPLQVTEDGEVIESKTEQASVEAVEETGNEPDDTAENTMGIQEEKEESLF